MASAASQTWVIAYHYLDSHTHEMTVCKLIYYSILYNGKDWKQPEYVLMQWIPILLLVYGHE